MAITRQEAWCERGGEVAVRVTDVLRRTIEQVGFCARESDAARCHQAARARFTSRCSRT